MATVAEELRKILVDLAGWQEDFAAGSDFYGDLGMASVKAMQLLLEVEDRFGISLPDEDFVEATTLERLTELVERLRAANG